MRAIAISIFIFLTAACFQIAWGVDEAYYDATNQTLFPNKYIVNQNVMDRYDIERINETAQEYGLLGPGELPAEASFLQNAVGLYGIVKGFIEILSYATFGFDKFVLNIFPSLPIVIANAMKGIVLIIHILAIMSIIRGFNIET